MSHKNEMLSRFAMAKAVLEDTREAAVSAVSEHAWAIDAAQKDLKRFTDIITAAGLEATPEALRAALQGLGGRTPAQEAASPAAALSVDLPRTQRVASDRDHLPDLPAKEEDGPIDRIVPSTPDQQRDQREADLVGALQMVQTDGGFSDLHEVTRTFVNDVIGAKTLFGQPFSKGTVVPTPPFLDGDAVQHSSGYNGRVVSTKLPVGTVWIVEVDFPGFTQRRTFHVDTEHPEMSAIKPFSGFFDEPSTPPSMPPPDGEPDATTEVPPLPPLTLGDRVRIARAPFCTDWPVDRWASDRDDFDEPLAGIGATGTITKPPPGHPPLAADEVYVESDDVEHSIANINVSCLEPE